MLLWAVPGLLVRLYVDPATQGAEAALAIELLRRGRAVPAVRRRAGGGGGRAARRAGYARADDAQIFGYWAIGFVIAALLAFPLRMGPMGVWWGLAAGLGVVSALLLWRWHGRRALILAS